MAFNNIDDISRRKAALKAELKLHEKQIKSIKISLLTPAPSSKKNGKQAGLLSLVNSKNVVATTITVLDYAWMAWKLYKKFKKK